MQSGAESNMKQMERYKEQTCNSFTFTCQSLYAGFYVENLQDFVKIYMNEGNSSCSLRNETDP